MTLCFITNLDLLIIVHTLNCDKHDYSGICMRYEMSKWVLIIIISNTFVIFYSLASQCSWRTHWFRMGFFLCNNTLEFKPGLLFPEAHKSFVPCNFEPRWVLSSPKNHLRFLRTYFRGESVNGEKLQDRESVSRHLYIQTCTLQQPCNHNSTKTVSNLIQYISTAQQTYSLQNYHRFRHNEWTPLIISMKTDKHMTRIWQAP